MATFDRDQLHDDLVEWLSRAEEGEGEEGVIAHSGHANLLKATYGMRVRSRPGGASASSGRLT